MNKRFLLYSALFCAFCLASCSIDKRLYRGGYHVEWTGAKETGEQGEAGKRGREFADPNNYEESKQAEPGLEEYSTAAAEQLPLVLPPKAGPVKEKILVKSLRISVPEKKQSYVKDKPEGKENKVVHPLAFASFLLALAEIICFLLASTIFSFRFGVAAFIFGLLALALGKKALKEIRSGDGTITGKGYAIFGIVSGTLAIVVLFLFIILFLGL